eukprot:TRINITY_DN19798_c0_g1_i1.p1 TRINITY_DN19798_c0_g1~~TRINITY_DN19798_c0_g1_i1.p1  ORF type:complete len:337 (+),score=64.03 TRINITY_DN19798_c0_g1_i1:225-1235(+)
MIVHSWIDFSYPLLAHVGYMFTHISDLLSMFNPQDQAELNKFIRLKQAGIPTDYKGLQAFVAQLMEGNKSFQKQFSSVDLISWLGKKKQLKPSDVEMIATTLIEFELMKPFPPHTISHFWSRRCQYTFELTKEERQAAMTRLYIFSPPPVPPYTKRFRKTTEKTIVASTNAITPAINIPERTYMKTSTNSITSASTATTATTLPTYPSTTPTIPILTLPLVLTTPSTTPTPSPSTTPKANLFSTNKILSEESSLQSSSNTPSQSQSQQDSLTPSPQTTSLKSVLPTSTPPPTPKKMATTKTAVTATTTATATAPTPSLPLNLIIHKIPAFPSFSLR